MNKTKQFSGIIPPVSTLFTDDGILDKVRMGGVIDFLIRSGVDGLFFLGTGGEFSQMSTEERKQVAEFSVNYVDKRVPTLIGTGSTNTREAIELSTHAQSIGASGIVVINPYYWQLTEDNLFNYFSEVSSSVDLPVILYNFPNLTGQDLSPTFVKSLVDKNINIVGIKETIDSIAHLREMIFSLKDEHPNFSVFCGFDDHLLNTLLLGGDGAISASANFVPELSIDIFQAFSSGDLGQAAELHKTLLQLPLIYKIDSPFVNVVKEAMKLCGQDISTYSLPPTRPLSEEKREQVKRILQNANIVR